MRKFEKQHLVGYGSKRPNFYYPVDRVVETQQAIMFYVYVIESVKSYNLYVGFTKDLKNRLEEHNRGLNFSTRSYKPWQLIHYEMYINEEDARRREKYLKTSQGSRLLKRMLKEYFYEKSRKIS